MIAYLEGKLIAKKDKYVIVDVGGVGYKVFISKNSILKLPEVGQNIKLFTYLKVAENVMDLYGFVTQDELDFFEVLNDIRGVGPKASLEISSLGSLEKIKDKILQQDESIFATIPGIGAKRASTIILELTGKIKTLSGKSQSADPVQDALLQLGFTKAQAKDALANLPSEVKDTEERIKLALKNLGR